MGPFDDPRTRSLATGIVLALLAFLALLLRRALDIDGVLDIDAINLGLGALRFDIVEHQPHPPGFPGYLLLLKAIRGLAPSLGAVDIATWGSALCGAASVPAAFLAARALLSLGDETRALGRPLCAALFAALSPLLWYSGADGQTHAAEALLTLALVGTAAAVKRRPGTLRILSWMALLGFGGSVRPNIVWFCAPLGVFVLWSRPLRDWLLSLGMGLVVTALWLVAVSRASGGFWQYMQAGQSLYGLYVDRYSIFGSASTLTSVLINVNHAFHAFLFSAIPLLAITRPRVRGWPLALLAVIAVSTAYCTLIYTAEAGYFAGVAALCCLVPATWPDRLPRSLSVRAALSLGACPVCFLLAPSELPMIGRQAPVSTPTLAAIQAQEGRQQVFRQTLCPTPGLETLVASDSLVIDALRLLPLTCPGTTVAVLCQRHPLNAKFDNIFIYYADGMKSVPGPVPFALGPPSRVSLPRPVRRVLLGPDVSEAFVAQALAEARCPPEAGAPGTPGPRWPDGPLVFPARCLPRLRTHSHTLVIPAIPR